MKALLGGNGTCTSVEMVVDAVDSDEPPLEMGGASLKYGLL